MLLFFFMPIIIDAEGCKKIGGIPLGDSQCQITKDMIHHFAHELTLTPYGKSYADALWSDRIPDDDERAILVQGRYISNNCSTETPEQNEAWYILSSLEMNKPLPVYRPQDKFITELELDHLATDITDWTAKEPRDADDKFPLKAFEDYAEMHGVALDKVLVAQDWVDESLSDETIERIKEAKKRVKIKWE